MNILQVTKKYPFPQNDGESWAVTALARDLKSQGCRLHLVSLVHPHLEVAQRDVEQRDIYESVQTIALDVTPNKISALKNLMTNRSYHEKRFESAMYPNDLSLIPQTYDFIIAETIYALPLARILAIGDKTKVILRSHNIEHQIWEEYASLCEWPKSKYFKSQASRLKRYELKSMQDVNSILWISDTDKRYADQENISVSSKVIPISKLAQKSSSYKSEAPKVIGFLGSLDWRPNIHGVLHFLKDIWPVIHESESDIRLMIAGKNPGKSLMSQYQEDVTLIGEVPDSAGYLRQLDALIVPLWAGSGTRVKIIEALSLGVPVITTLKGMEGLHLTADVNVLVVEEPASWLAAIRRLDDHIKMNDQIRSGLDYITDHHNPQSIGKRAYDYLSNLG